jgi:hypothetical protein
MGSWSDKVWEHLAYAILNEIHLPFKQFHTQGIDPSPSTGPHDTFPNIMDVFITSSHALVKLKMGTPNS